MAIKSMTGCGSGCAAAGGVRVEVQLSSVNRKQFDVDISLPRSIGVLEPRISELVQKAISRGHVTGAVNVNVSGKAVERCVSVDRDMAKAYIRALRKTVVELGLKDDLSARVLVSLPGVIKYESSPDDSEQIWPLVRKAVQQAVLKLVAMRLREGKVLQNEMRRNFESLLRLLSAITTAAPEVTKRYRVILQERIEKSGVAGGLSADQLLKEVALFADRCDISEEILRLESHFKQVFSALQASEPVGRTMDFLCQEMFREINTIGSKANSGAISEQVVKFKAGLESIREQVQNVE